MISSSQCKGWCLLRNAVHWQWPLSSVTPLLGSLQEQLINSIQRLFPEGIATLKLKGAFLFYTIPQFFKDSFLTYLYQQAHSVEWRSNKRVTRYSLCCLCLAIVAPTVHPPCFTIWNDCPCIHLTCPVFMECLLVLPRSPEEACLQLFQEAWRNVPAIIYLPLMYVAIVCLNSP